MVGHKLSPVASWIAAQDQHDSPNFLGEDSSECKASQVQVHAGLVPLAPSAAPHISASEDGRAEASPDAKRTTPPPSPGQACPYSACHWFQGVVCPVETRMCSSYQIERSPYHRGRDALSKEADMGFNQGAKE